MHDRARRLTLVGIVGPVVFGAAAILSALINGASGDGYSQVHSFVSELAAEGSRSRVLMTAGFLTLGLCLLVFAWSVRQLRPAATTLALLIALSGVGTLMAGTFSCDKGCPAEGVTSTHQDLHNLSSVITFSAWILAPLAAGWQLRGSRLGRLSIAFGVVELAISLWLQRYATDRQPDDPVGVLQRAVLLVVFTWFVVAALDVRRAAGRRAPP
jgi:hypothetical membrane protein